MTTAKEFAQITADAYLTYKGFEITDFKKGQKVAFKSRNNEGKLEVMAGEIKNEHGMTVVVIGSDGKEREFMAAFANRQLKVID